MFGEARRLKIDNPIGDQVGTLDVLEDVYYDDKALLAALTQAGYLHCEDDYKLTDSTVENTVYVCSAARPHVYFFEVYPDE